MDNSAKSNPLAAQTEPVQFQLAGVFYHIDVPKLEANWVVAAQTAGGEKLLWAEQYGFALESPALGGEKRLLSLDEAKMSLIATFAPASAQTCLIEHYKKFGRSDRL